MNPDELIHDENADIALTLTQSMIDGIPDGYLSDIGCSRVNCRCKVNEGTWDDMIYEDVMTLTFELHIEKSPEFSIVPPNEF